MILILITKIYFHQSNSEEKREKLMKAIDYTNIKYGTPFFKYCASRIEKKCGIAKDNIILKLIQHAFRFFTYC